MARYIFYSWQSDLPNNTNRSFIETALANVAKEISADASFKVDPVLDRDTAGTPGAPDITKTILEKIDRAAAVVCDVSIIPGNANCRKTPNPNVLIELGYAMKSLGAERIVLVMNTEFGNVEQLPFDLRARRILTYDMPKDAPERSPIRKTLERDFATAIRTILQMSVEADALDTTAEVRAAIESRNSGASRLIRQFMDRLSSQLDDLAPKFSELAKNEWDDALIHAIGQTDQIVCDFAQIAEAIAGADSLPDGRLLYHGFERLLGGYYVPAAFSGAFNRVDFDLHKFVGHELFVCYLATLIRDERWEIIDNILSENLYVENAQQYPDGSVPFTYVSQHVELTMRRNERLNLRRVCLHSDILNDRHAKSPLSEVVPMQDFIDADCFLFLRAEFQAKKENDFPRWWAWSTLHMKRVPRFLALSRKSAYAEKLLGPLGIDTIESFRERFSQAAPKLQRVFHQAVLFEPFEDFDPQSIGSE